MTDPPAATNSDRQPPPAGPSVAVDGVGVRGSLPGPVSATFAAGSATAVIGPSGAGKSTLLRVIAGFLAPDAGRVRFDDHVAADSGRLHLQPAARSLGYLPQDLGLWDHLTARRHLRVVLDAAQPAASRSDRRSAVEQMLARLDLTEAADRRAGLLSGGERRRLALGRALVPSPRLLLLDEPFSGVDYALRDLLLALLDDYRQSARPTLVTVSHLREETVELAEQVLVMTDGRVVETGPLADVRARPQSAFAQRYFRDGH